MVAAVVNDVGNNGSGIGITGGSTWTSLDSGLLGGIGYRLFWKIAGSSEPANYSVSYNGASSAYAVAQIVTSNDAGTGAPVWAKTATAGSGTTGPTPGITPPDATALEVRFILAGVESPATRTWTAPVGLTEQTEIQQSQFPNGSSATRTLVSGSATTSLNFTANGAVVDRVGYTVGVPSANTDQNITPTGIASGGAFGAAQLNFTIIGQGIASGETFGDLIISTPFPQTITGQGIVSAETFGTLRTRLYLDPTGIATGEAFGTPRLAALIAPTGIPSAEAFGATNLGIEQFLTLIGIPSGEELGEPGLQLGYPQTIEAIGIPSLERMTQQPVIRLVHRLTFRPPSVQETPAGINVLHLRYGVHRGISVIRRADGTIYQTRYPALTDLEAARTYWLGGYAHEVSVADAVVLTEAGYGSYITLEEVA